MRWCSLNSSIFFTLLVPHPVNRKTLALRKGLMAFFSICFSIFVQGRVGIQKRERHNSIPVRRRWAGFWISQGIFGRWIWMAVYSAMAAEPSSRRENTAGEEVEKDGKVFFFKNFKSELRKKIIFNYLSTILCHLLWYIRQYAAEGMSHLCYLGCHSMQC